MFVMRQLREEDGIVLPASAFQWVIQRHFQSQQDNLRQRALGVLQTLLQLGMPQDDETLHVSVRKCFEDDGASQAVLQKVESLLDGEVV